MMTREKENLTAAFPDTYLTFRLNGKDFGFEARCLWEISLSTAVSPLPPSAPFLVGITHLHGKIVPVLDLAALLELPSSAPAPARGFVAVKPFGWEAPSGFYVEDILGFEKFQGEGIKPMPLKDGGIFRKGYADLPDRRVELLDMDLILSSLRLSTPADAPTEVGRN